MGWRKLASFGLMAAFMAMLAGTSKPKSDQADAGATTATPTTPATPATPDSADAALAPSAAPTAETPADAVFTPPGACVDPRRDAEKRANGGGRAIDLPSLDLDGDGKPDKLIQFGIGGDDRASPVFLYIMSGSCGVFVGDVTASVVRLSGSRSKGLKSIDAISNDTGCTDNCTCKDKATGFFFNGKKYQSNGKVRDVARKCVAVKLPTCAPSQGLFAEAEGSPVFCGRSCSADAECKPAKCDSFAFSVDKTGAVFTGVGRSVPICGKGAPATAPPTAAPTALTVPPGAPPIIPNPTLLDCPDGYTKLIGTKSCNKSCRSQPCTGGTKCTPPMSVCM
jgi:hypothetical protein